MLYTNFQIGEKFPLLIRQQGEGGLFQVDVNGAMFILQLAKSDIIAIEAFRTGEVELALCEEDGILFLLYRIPGIFKEGWGDAPLSFGSLAAEQRPAEKSLADGRLHLSLVDARLSILLAQREATMPAPFAAQLRRHVQEAAETPLSPASFAARVQAVWQSMSPAAMRENAAAVWEIPLALKGARLH